MDVMAATEFLARSTTLTSVGWIGYIINGALAGWIAGKIVKGGGSGILMYIVIGVIGALIGGESLVHVAHYIRPAPGPANRPLRLTRAQYARLVARIEAALAPAALRARHRGYAAYDVFYSARGQYDWRNTCNQWTSDTLAAAGVKTGRWTPFAVRRGSARCSRRAWPSAPSSRSTRCCSASWRPPPS